MPSGEDPRGWLRVQAYSDIRVEIPGRLKLAKLIRSETISGYMTFYHKCACNVRVVPFLLKLAGLAYFSGFEHGIWKTQKMIHKNSSVYTADKNDIGLNFNQIAVGSCVRCV